MNHTTFDKIKDHLKQSEGELKHPYLDIKGNVTIGVGFKTKSEDDFAKLDLHILKDSKWVLANNDEKREAFRQMQAEKEKRGGNLNVDPDKYKDKTNVRMLPPDQDAELDRKISKNVQDIKNDVGEDAWDKLTNGQKAAVADIVHANGSLDGFPELTKAIQKGDAKKMADESPFYTDREKGLRAMDRLQRNYEALSGLSREEAKKGLDEALTKNSTIRNATPPDKPEPPEKPSAPGDDGGPADGGPSGSAGDDPSGDDTSDDDPSDDDSSGDDSSGDAQKQSASFDAVPAPETKELKPGQKALAQNFVKSDGRLDDILVKNPRDLTYDEFLELKKEMINLPAGPEQERLDEMATNFLDDKFGTGPAEVDAVGRVIDPQPIRPINENPVPAKTPENELLSGAIRKIGIKVARAAGDEGNARAVQNLQLGLNLLSKVNFKGGPKFPARILGIVPDLKTDGVVGPKTRRALRFATSRLGRPKIEEGFALGRFHEFARDGWKQGFERLGKATEKSFAPLFRSPARPVRRPADRVENVTLQETLNDLGRSQFGLDQFKTLKLDGAIGPRTTETFGRLTDALGPERVTKRFGELLGFL